ncbi:Alsin, partial [Lamellibrachia satsuma]
SILFPVLPPAESEAVEICSESVADPSRTGQIDEPTEVFSPAGLLHPILLPKLYPPLFDLYALYNEKEDDVYWKRVLHWNRQPDIALMSYLGLAQDFWLVEESAYANPRQRLSNVKECSYTGAIDMLQRL